MGCSTSTSTTSTRSPPTSAQPPQGDGPEELVPLDPLTPARQRPLPRLPRGGLPDRVVAGSGTLPRPARVPLRPGAGNRRGRGTASLARPGGANLAPLA